MPHIREGVFAIDISDLRVCFELWYLQALLSQAMEMFGNIITLFSLPEELLFISKEEMLNVSTAIDDKAVNVLVGKSKFCKTNHEDSGREITVISIAQVRRKTSL